jgi:hypothetical protein
MQQGVTDMGRLDNYDTLCFPLADSTHAAKRGVTNMESLRAIAIIVTMAASLAVILALLLI